MKRQNELTREEARELAASISPLLKVLTRKFQLAGSYRRGNRSVGDLDFVTVGCNFAELEMHLVEKLGDLEVVRAGPAYFTVVVPFKGKRIQVEFLNVNRYAFGSGLLHSTGSGTFNIGLRVFAKSKGFTLSQHGLFRDQEFVAGKTEEEVFSALGLSFIAPRERNTDFNLLKRLHIVDPRRGAIPPKGEGGRVWYVQGDTDNYVVKYLEGRWTCTCMAFRFRSSMRRTSCKHIDEIRKKAGL